MELVLVIVDKPQANENKINTYILIIKYKIISAKRNSNMFIKRTNK